MDKKTKDVHMARDDLGGEIILKSGTTFQFSLHNLKGTLWLKLYDEIGAFTIGEVDYRVQGPNGENYKGKTDDEGELMHENVLIGDFEITVDDKYHIIAPSLLNARSPHEHLVKGYMHPEKENEESDDDQAVEDEARDLIRDPLEGEGDEIPEDLNPNDLYDEE